MYLQNKVIQQENEIDLKLSQEFNVSREELKEVAQKAALVRLECGANFPPTFPGTATWGYGTDALCGKMLKNQNWFRGVLKNITFVYNDIQKKIIIFQNVDQACDPMNPPRLLHLKGPMSTSLIDINQGDLFGQPSNISLGIPKNFELWYFCFSFQIYNGLDIRAELSRPGPLLKRQLDEFHERIFILEKGDDGFASIMENKGPSPSDYELDVTRNRKKI